MFQKELLYFSPAAKEKDKALSCEDIEQWRLMAFMETPAKAYFKFSEGMGKEGEVVG